MAYNQTCILIQNCVGIGTDTPLGSLTVKQTSTDGGATGGISIINDNNELKGSLFAGGSAPRPYGHLLLRDASNNDSVMLRTTGASNFILQGNFGIGTCNPGAILHVRTTAITAGAPSTGWPSYNIEDSTTSKVVCIDTAGNGDVSTAGQGATLSLILGQYFDSRVVITPAGAGSLVPADQGTGNGRDLMVKGGYSDNTNGKCGGRLWLNGGMGYSGGFNANVGHIIMQTVGGGGNVGIGCTTPTNTLEVNGTGRFACTVNIGTSASSASRFQLNFQNWNATNSYPYITFQNPAANCRHGIGINTSDNFVIGRATGVDCNFAHQDFVIVNSTGNVGINCLTPSYKLHVNGTFYAAGSSQDYKQSICNYNTDSCMFMKLKPVTYQYKEEYCHLGKELKSGTQIGLIAEEVAESHPELAILVNEEDEKVVRNVDYEKLTIILLSELQKLRQEVDQLKNK